MNMNDVVTIKLNCTHPNCPNISDFIGDHPLFAYNKTPNIVLISAYVPLFLVALISNILVIIVVNRYQCLKSVTNYFLVNLSVADLLVTLVCMPMAVGQATYSVWIYGAFMCKLSNYLQGVAVGSGVFTITAMSLDRYMAICRPMSRKIINKHRAIKIIAFIWVVALILFAPILFIRKTRGFRFAWDVESGDFLYCVEFWPAYLSQRYFGIFYFVFVYAIPGCIVVVAYSLMGLRLSSHQLLPEYELTCRFSTGIRNNDNGLHENPNNATINSSSQVCSAGEGIIRKRRRLARVLLVLPLVFAICWLPYSVLTLFLDLSSKPEVEEQWNTEVNDADEKYISIVTILLPYSLLLGHFNSAVNPLLCCFLSKKYQSSVIDLISQFCRAILNLKTCNIRTIFWRNPHPSMEQSSQDNNEYAPCLHRDNYLPNSPTRRPYPANSNQPACVEDYGLDDWTSLSSNLGCDKRTNLTVSGSTPNRSYYYHHVHNSMAITNQDMVVVQTVVIYTPNFSTRYCLNNGRIASRLLKSGLDSCYNHVSQTIWGRSSTVKYSVSNIRTCNTCHKLVCSCNLFTEGGKPFVRKTDRAKVRKVKVLNTVSEESESYSSQEEK